MNITIRQSAGLSDGERKTLFEAEPDSFGVAHLGLRWRPKDIYFLLDLDSEPTAVVGLLLHDLRTEPETVRLAGLGSVTTVSHARGRGHASTLVRHAVAHAQSVLGADAVLLFCLPRLVSFYQSHGFHVVPAPVLIEQPAGLRAAPLEVMVSSFDSRPWPQGPVTLGSLPW